MKSKHISLYKIYISWYDGQGWFRWNRGYGLAWKNLNKHRLYFSERNGYTKTYKIFNYSFKILKPE